MSPDGKHIATGSNNNEVRLRLRLNRGTPALFWSFLVYFVPVCVCVCQLHLFSVDSGKSEATIDTGGKFTCSVKWVSTDCVCVACVRVSVCVRALCLCVHL